MEKMIECEGKKERKRERENREGKRNVYITISITYKIEGNEIYSSLKIVAVRKLNWFRNIKQIY